MSDGKITLHYWAGRGLMEVSRVMLALAGKFPEDDYEDARWWMGVEAAADGKLTNPRPMSEVEKHVELGANCGRLPILNVEGKGSVGQSLAIWFYIASELGMMGSNYFEAAQIISIAETIKETSEAFRKLVPYGEEPNAENVDKWFSEGATDATGKADMAQRGNRQLHWFMGRLENLIPGDGGFAVGGKLSLADVLIYNAFAETLEDAQCSEAVKPFGKQPYTDKKRTSEELAKHPKLKAIVDNIAGNANFQKWLSVRGVQNF
jgi:glutathione S-transferase